MIIQKNNNTILLQCSKGSLENYKNFLKNKEKLWIQNETGGYIQTAVITNTNSKNNTFVFKIQNYEKLNKKNIFNFLKVNNITIIKELPNW